MIFFFKNFKHCRVKEGKDELRMSSEKLQTLGWKYRPLKETVVDSVENYKHLGILWS